MANEIKITTGSTSACFTELIIEVNGKKQSHVVPTNGYKTIEEWKQKLKLEA